MPHVAWRSAMSVTLHIKLLVVPTLAADRSPRATGSWLGALAAARVPLRRLALWSGGVAPGERFGDESCGRGMRAVAGGLELWQGPIARLRELLTLWTTLLHVCGCGAHRCRGGHHVQMC